MIRSVEDLVKYYSSKNAKIILLSEYGISNVDNPIHINRVLRQNNLLGIRIERGLELLDAGASKAFAVADHQVAHIYVNDPAEYQKVLGVVSNIEGVAKVLTKEDQKNFHIDHERVGRYYIDG